MTAAGPGAPGPTPSAAHVRILLSTYRGARYLPAQLESLRTQTHPHWSLSWRDDGSDDGTVETMARFCDRVGESSCAPLGNDGVHLGIAASFLRLLGLFVAEGRTGPVAFADQDDIWLPEKLARAVDALAPVPDDRPTLYCARQMLTDTAMRTIGPSPPIRQPPRFPNALAQNVATGCTIVLNPSAARLVASCPAPEGTLHDWWSYLVVTACGGTVIADPIPTVLYRQHGENAVGASLSPTRRAIAALRRGPGPFMYLLRSHLAGLAACADRLTPEARRIVTDMGRLLAQGPSGRMRLLAAANPQRQSRLETLLFRLWLLSG